MKYIFKEYDDNLNPTKLVKIPSKKLWEIASQCNGLCEICRVYIDTLYERLRELEKKEVGVRKK